MARIRHLDAARVVAHELAQQAALLIRQRRLLRRRGELRSSGDRPAEHGKQRQAAEEASPNGRRDQR
jgi:hypothetical protein